MRALRDPLRVRAGGDARDLRERPRHRPKRRLDPELTAPERRTELRAAVLTCALAAEERAARRGGATRTARVGLGATLPLPEEPLVSFGVAGALVEGLAPGDLVTATRVLAARGAVLWEGEPLLPGRARPVVLAAVDDLVDDPLERAALARATGAEVADLESGRLAASGRLLGVVRAVSDTAAEPVRGVAGAARPDGSVSLRALVAALLREPRASVVAMRNGRRALVALEDAARELLR